MARRRNAQLSPELAGLAGAFAEAVAQLVERTIAERVGANVAALAKAIRPAARGAARARSHRPAHTLRDCPFPGCTEQSKGPRFSWFCAIHRKLPEAERERILNR